MAQVKDITTEFALFGKLASEILGRDVLRGAVVVTPKLVQLDDIPSVEPQRTDAFLDKIRVVSEQLITSLAHPEKRVSFLIKGNVLTILINIVRDDPFTQSFDSSVILKARPVIQKLTFECLLLVNELSAVALPRRASELLFASLRILQTKVDVKLRDCSQEYSTLAIRVYQFITACLDSFLIVDLFSASLLRDISHCIVSDVAQSSDVSLKHSALTCLISLLQTRAGDLKTETKDKIFSALIIALRTTALFPADRFSSEKDISVTKQLYSSLCTFVLSTAVHAGVLNICNTVFRNGIQIRDAEIKAICRNGLQVIDTILRPRAPREAFETPCNYIKEPATGQVTATRQSNVAKRAHTETNAVFVDQSVPTASANNGQKEHPVPSSFISAASSQNTEPITVDQDVAMENVILIEPAVVSDSVDFLSGVNEPSSKRTKNELAAEYTTLEENESPGRISVEDLSDMKYAVNEPPISELSADAAELIAFFKDVESDNHSL